MLKRIIVEILVEVPPSDPGFVPELEVYVANTRTELAHRAHPTLTSLIQYVITHLNGSPCQCCRSDYLSAPIPGIRARIEGGRVAEHAKVERCDKCECFRSDAAAEVALNLYMAHQDFYAL
jgi:hypothetical protein